MRARNLKDHGAESMVKAVKELVSGERYVAVWWLTNHPAGIRSYSQALVGIGWEPETDSFRWLGEGMDPSGVGSYFFAQCDEDPLLMVAKLALHLMARRDAIGHEDLWFFFQGDARTIAQAKQL